MSSGSAQQTVVNAIRGRLDSNLLHLIAASSTAIGQFVQATIGRSLSVASTAGMDLATDISDGFVTVDTTAGDGDGAALLKQLEAIGLQHGSAYGAVASGLLPVADVSALLGVANLGYAQEAVSRTSAVAPMPSQYSSAVRADVARSTYGFDGTGVTVGILSDSFNEASYAGPDGTADTMTSDIANGYLPQNTQILNDDPISSRATDEGRAMAQIVHQIAPGASIVFDTAEGGQATFAQHILDLAAAGAKVIVDDESYLAEPDYQDGVIAQAIKTVEAEGVTYLSSAGNDGANGYEGAFQGDQAFSYNGRSYVADQFGPASGTVGDLLPITVGPLAAGAKETIHFELQWDQPAASANASDGGATGDLDLFFTDANGNVLGQLATQGNNVGGDPSEVLGITFTNNGSSTATFNYDLKVGLASGTTAPTDIRVIASGDGYPITIGAEASNTNTGTLVGHHGQEGSSAVGAVYYKNSPAYGTSSPVNERYSSPGVDKVYFADDGTPQAPQANGVTFSAIDGGDTSFFGSDPDGDGFPNFYGTSAAAPSAAAVAALMLQANPNLTPSQVQSCLARSAISTTGGTAVGGAGLIRADVAVASVLPDPGPTVSVAGSIATLEKGQTEQVGSVTPGAPDRTVTLNQIAGSGTLSLGFRQSDGSYQVLYTAPAAVPASGTDSISFTATDGSSSATAVGPVAVAVPLDSGPVLAQQAPKTVEAGQTTAIGTVSPGLPGDTEMLTQTGGTPGAVSLVPLSGSSGGLQIVYTAPKSTSVSGVDMVAYLIADQHNDAAVTGSAGVQIDPGPTAGAVSVSVNLGTTTDLTAAVLKAAGLGLAGDSVTVTADNTSGTKGSVSLSGGDLKYSASGTNLSHIPANGMQADGFAYTITDEYGGTSSGTVSLTVSNPATVINGPSKGSGTIQGTAGTDVINAFGQSNRIYANGGNDVINAGQARATVYAGAGDVTINLKGTADSVVGGDGNETVSGSTGSTSITLGNGDDGVSAGGTSNTIKLGNGNDSVSAVGGGATIAVGSGTDTVKIGGTGNTVTLNGSKGTVSGGQGRDTVTVNSGTDTLTFAGSYDTANINGTAAVAITDLASALRINVGSSTQTDQITGFFSHDAHGLIDLLNGAGGYKTTSAVLSHLASDGNGGTMLALSATTSIDFVGTSRSQFSVSNFRIG